ncbi:MAG: hypothetical protein HYX47_12005 [Burkholderiales bacterium]|nr:hypothetical protein [Burkholderiales bacterium]
MKTIAVQKQIPLGALPIPAANVDLFRRDTGIDHLSRGLAQAVRRVQPMPQELRPNLQGMPLMMQIATLWKAYERFSLRLEPRADDANQRLRLRRIARLYQDLQTVGCGLIQADGLRERHARLLLKSWRERGKAVATIRSDWSILRVWCLALGKAGMISPLENYWPDAPKAVAPGEARAQKRLEWHRNPQILAMLLRGRDPTHWFVERLCGDLGLTVEEALAFSPDMASQYLDGRLLIRAPRHQDFRTIPVGSHEQVLLVQEIQAFMSERRRRRLMWPDISPLEARRKHENHLAYQRRKLEASEECGSGQASEGGSE